jgi:RNA polymerase sigma-70 factor (ECF subfamily)
MTEEDWAQACVDLGPRLLRYFSGQFPPHAAADLVQETLIRLVRKTREGALDPARGSLRMYAFGIARFVRLEQKPETWAATDTELAGHRQADDSRSEEPDAETQLIAEEQRRWLRAALARLNEDQRDVLLLHIDREMTLDDIARLTRQPLGTVKSHIHRAKEELRRLRHKEMPHEA